MAVGAEGRQERERRERPAAIPLPVSALLRRARNAKSPKDRHDTAYFAWEASVVLAVAARPPEDLAPLQRPSVGTWVAAYGAQAGREGRFSEGPLLRALAHLAEHGGGRKATPKSLSPKELLDALPPYRNQVIGHGSVREGAFYDAAGPLLVEGLEEAWARGFFLAPGERLLYAESVEIEATGRRRARLLELSGDAAHVLDPRGTPDVPDWLVPHRVCLKAGESYRSLHPWVLCLATEIREAVYLFLSAHHRVRYLDYVGGEALAGAALEKAFPGVEAEAFALFQANASLEPLPETDEPDRFGEYRILGRLGEGGMGVVHLARQESLGRLVALKTLPPSLAEDPVAVARFEREVAALSRCEHPNVVKVLASGVARGQRYYAMEYVEGADLARIAHALAESDDLASAATSAWRSLLDEKREILEGVVRPPPPGPAPKARGEMAQIAVAFRDAARGLHHLHEAGIVHRDVKPGNLMMAAADRRVVVMDLGLASVTNASQSITKEQGSILGTLLYMAPEQLQRNLLTVDRRADVFGLGATFYELLTGRPLRDGDTQARLIEQILKATPPEARKVNPAVPADLSTIVQKATDREPGLRYETAEALAQDLEAFLEGRPISARPPSLGYVLRLAIRRNKPLATTIAAAVVVIVGLVTYFLRSVTAERDEKAAALVEVGRERDRANLERDAKGKALEEVARERDEKTRALDDVLRLSDAKKVADLVAEADRLWPLVPEQAGAMATWIERAKGVLRNRDDHRRRLASIREGALPYGDAERKRDHAEGRRQIEAAIRRLEEIEAAKGKVEGEDAEAKREALEGQAKTLREEVARIEGTLSERRTWTFPDPNVDWQHQVVVDLLAGLDRLEGGGKGGALAQVERRHTFVTTLRARSVEEPAEAWKQTIEGIAASPKYGGLHITRQLGLVPLGPDPESGLYEFAHLGSGSIPQRDPETRRLVYADDAAVVLVLVPGGTFRMGAQKEDANGPNFDPQAEDDESPVHEVMLSPFFLAKHECTQAQWEAMTEGLDPSTYKAGQTVGDRPLTPRNPVEQVSWEDCDLWLVRNRLVLPTEAQWEYGCRAGTDTPWITGRDVAALAKVANIADAYLKGHGGATFTVTPEVDDGHTVHAPVGSFAANALGLHDVHGNVYEWCRDVYAAGAYGRGAVSDPLVTQGSGLRMSRGGSWNIGARVARSAIRHRYAPGNRVNILGVRPARPLLP